MKYEEYPVHESQRGYFARDLYFAMQRRKDIVLLTGDLGYKMFDNHRRDFPDQFINCGASEQAMIGIATGMVYRGKLPIVYSITNFLLYRPFEWLRNYVDHEKLKMILVGGGRDYDYFHDGWTHHSPDAKHILSCLPNIRCYFPDSKEAVVGVFKDAIQEIGPSFISLTR